MDVIALLPPVTAAQALRGMRQPFLRSFGHSLVGRRLARSAWPAFQSALLHEAGMAVALSHAHAAAAEANVRTLLVVRWSERRIAHAVKRAAAAAAAAR